MRDERGNLWQNSKCVRLKAQKYRRTLICFLPFGRKIDFYTSGKKTAFKIKMWDFKLTVNDRNRTCRSPCKRLLGRAFGRRGEEEMEERRKQRERNQIRVMAEYFIFNQSGKRKEEESASNVKERNRYENLFAWENISSHSVFEERRVIVWIYFFKLKKKKMEVSWVNPQLGIRCVI